jgi:hypothetical protein
VGGSIKEGIKVGISSNEGIKKSQKLELKDICRYKTADCILLAQYTLHLPYNFNCLTNTPRIANMGRTSKWGNRTFKKGNKEDDAVRQSIYHKIWDIEEPEDPSTILKPEVSTYWIRIGNRTQLMLLGRFSGS